MSAAADRPIHLRLGTRVAILGSLLVTAVWLAAAWGWMGDRQEELDEEPATLAHEAERGVWLALQDRLAEPPFGLDLAVAAARARLAELERLRESKRGRKLVDEVDLPTLVREQLEVASTESGLLRSSWMRVGSEFTAGAGYRPRLRGGELLNGPCLLGSSGRAMLARCREMTLDDEVGTIAGAARTVEIPALLSLRGRRVAWGLFAAGPAGSRLAIQEWWPPHAGPYERPGPPNGRDDFERWARNQGWDLQLVDKPGYSATLVIAVAPAHRLAPLDLLRGSAGPLTEAWRRWAVRTGGIALTAILFFCFTGWRINAAFGPVVAAARSLGAENLDTQVPIRRSDEIGAIAAVLNDLGTSLKHARSHWEREAKLAAWRDVARGLAHEIKNPLTPIRGTVENLLRWRQEEPARFDAKVESRLGTILEEVEQLSRLASAFSDFAKLPPPQTAPADLNGLLSDVAALQLGDREGIVVDERLDAALGQVALDAGQIRQVATNLMKNAREALGEAGGTVRLESGRHGAGAWFAVSDDGPGVDEASLDSLFVPGWSTRKHEGGSGLGLWLCHRIVLEHGGGIEASRSELGGLRIRVTLPER
jgi:signal transduction histidine kinase